MNIQASILSPTRVALWLLISLTALSQVGCSSTGRGGLGDSQAVDLSKIFVYAVTPSPNLQLPVEHANAPQVLTQAIQQQLAAEHWLQTDERVHSLSLYGVILSYQDGVIDAQGELYDDEQFLVYSRVKRRLAPGENWEQGLNLVAEQMLDELMMKLHPGTGSAPPPCRQGDYGCGPVLIENCGVAGCPDPGPTIYIFDSLCFNCWRDDDHGHGGHDKPKPKPHWVPGAIIESAPRSSFTHDVKVHGPRGGERSTGRSDSGGYGGSSSTTGSTTPESRTDEPSTRPTRTTSEPRGRHESRGEPTPGTRSERSGETPRSREVERPQSAPVIHESPRSSETSRPVSVPEVRESAPAPRVETPVRSAPVESPRSETHSSSPAVHESPRSHESSSRSSDSSSSSSSSSSRSSSSSSSSSGGGHSGGHGGHRRD